MSTYLFPYKLASLSCKALADAMELTRIKPINSAYKPKQEDVIINWGSHNEAINQLASNLRVINHPSNVEAASNKLSAFRALTDAGINVPVYFTPDRFNQIPEAKRNKLYARTLLESHSGNGIHVVDYAGFQALGNQVKLVTLPVDNTSEWRVHVVNGRVIFVQKKAKPTGTDANPDIKTHAHGWIFKHMDIKPPQSMQNLAINAVAALGLDFGAVDIAYNKNTKTSTVFEINTAPGLEGETINAYRDAFFDLLNN